MRNLILLLLVSVFLCLNVSAQDSPADFWRNHCDFKTDGTSKSIGIKIKFSYPCSWKQEEGDRPHIVKKFTYNLGKGKSLIQTLTIKKMIGEPSKNEIAEMYTQKGLKEIASKVGTFVSGRKLKLDGIDCGEIVIKMKRESPIATFYIYIIQYFLVYKDKVINLSFASGAISENLARTTFATYKILFQALASNTVILSQWE